MPTWKLFSLNRRLAEHEWAEASCVLCSTADGWLQRVVVLGTETHVIEEIQLFETAQPVDSLTISHSKVRRRELVPLAYPKMVAWCIRWLWRGFVESENAWCLQGWLELELQTCLMGKLFYKAGGIESENMTQGGSREKMHTAGLELSL